MNNSIALVRATLLKRALESGVSSKKCITCSVKKPTKGYFYSKKNECKSCALARAAKRQKTDKCKEARKTPERKALASIANKKYYATPEAKELKKANRYKHNNSYKLRNPEKVAARQTVADALRSGKLIKKPCEVCNSTTNIHAHHENYSNRLDVIWLCKRHHDEIHLA